MASNTEQQPPDPLFDENSPGHLTIAYDRDGMFVHPRSYLTLSQSQTKGARPEEEFLSILQQHINETPVFSYIPDLQIEQYRLSDLKGSPPIGNMDNDPYIREKLLPHLQNKGIEPVFRVRLRDGVYAHSRGLDIHHVMNREHAQVNDARDYVDFMDHQRALQQAYGNNPIVSLPLHAIETPRGMLLFSNTELGMEGLKQFYQKLSDEYFNVAGAEGPVREWEVSYNSWNLNALVDRCYRRDSDDGKYRFQFEDAQYDHRQTPAPET